MKELTMIEKKKSRMTSIFDKLIHVLRVDEESGVSYLHTVCSVLSILNDKHMEMFLNDY